MKLWIHLTSLAACWALAAYFHYSAPRASGDAGDYTGGSSAAWPAPYSASMDEDTARILSTLYPARSCAAP